MKTLAIAFLFLTFLGNTNSYGQIFEEAKSPDERKFINSIYTEFGGAGILLSINYDLIINESSSIRFGATPTIISDPNSRDSRIFDTEQTFPIVGILSYSRLWGKSASRAETGLGVVFGDKISNRIEVGPPSLFLNFGYRIVPKSSNGLSFRASFTPFIKEQKVTPWAGVSIGYSFFKN